MTDYLTMLAVPADRAKRRRPFMRRVAKMLDLPVDVVARSRGFVRDAYLRHMRATDRKIVSSYDGELRGRRPVPGSGSGRVDPILEGFSRALSGAFVAYARDELGFKTDITYALLASEVNGRWDWHEGAGREPAGASDDLRVLLALSPSFRLLVSHGYSDLVTPYGVSRYVLDHLRRRPATPTARSFASTAAATCSISTRPRGAPSPPTRSRSIGTAVKRWHCEYAVVLSSAISALRDRAALLHHDRHIGDEHRGIIRIAWNGRIVEIIEPQVQRAAGAHREFVGPNGAAIGKEDREPDVASRSVALRIHAVSC